MSDAHALELERIVRGDPERMRILGIVRDLGLQDCWVAAGFVRNAVWDALHRRTPTQRYGDVDVIWFDRDADAGADEAVETALRLIDPGVRWSVKNQTRMHGRNADAPYASAAHAMCHWAETTAAIAVRMDEFGALVFSTPLGTDDLFGMVIRPGPRFRAEKHGIFIDRACEKRWLEHWPMLRFADDADGDGRR